ncbi:hypothetical protein [Endozoicomonas lisbonensis]|uniref:hypothetical protein n=1 Tax=Endozoicomonas lisbonensis TaxID=3120522 RepID=UPI00339411D4
MQALDRNYEHAYFKPDANCENHPTIRRGGVRDQFLLISVCVSDASNNHYELCFPMGPARQFAVSDLIDTNDEFRPVPEYTEKKVRLFLSQVEKLYNPQNPLANRHIESLLGSGISAQVMKPVSFLRSAAVKRIIHELPDKQSADDFILTAQINMRLLTMAEIEYLPLMYFSVPARKKGMRAIYGVQKKHNAIQFLDHLFEDPHQPLSALKKHLDDIVGLLVDCDIANARQFQTLASMANGFSIAVDPNYTNYFVDGDHAKVVDLTPFFMAFEGMLPEINSQFIDMDLDGIDRHFHSLSLNPLHRYLFFLGMLFRTSQARTKAYQRCLISGMICQAEKQKDEVWKLLFDHALEKVASLPPLYNEMLRRVEERRLSTGLPPASEVQHNKRHSSDLFAEGQEVSAAYHSDAAALNRSRHPPNRARMDSTLLFMKILRLEASMMASKVDHWRQQRRQKWHKTAQPFYDEQHERHSIHVTPYFMDDIEAESYTNFILGLKYHRTNLTSSSLWLCFSNWLDRKRPANHLYKGSLSASELRRMVQITLSKHLDGRKIDLEAVDNIPALLEALDDIGYYFEVQVIQPDEQFKPRSTSYWFDHNQRKVITEDIHDLRRIRQLTGQSHVISLLLHQTSDAPAGSAKSRWSLVSEMSAEKADIIQRYPFELVASWRFKSMNKFETSEALKDESDLQNSSSYYLKLTALISAYQKTLFPSLLSRLSKQLEYHLPSENKQARMELGVRVGHLFMALLHWLDALESFADDELPDTVLLIQPGLGYRIGTPLFSMWTFKFTKHKPRVITRELRHNVKLESIKTNKPGRLIFFTNVMTSSTGHFLSAYGSKPDWWIINRPDVPDSQKQNNKLSEIKPVIAENSTDNLKIELSSEDKNNNASNETLVFAMLNYLKEKYEELVNKSGMSE